MPFPIRAFLVTSSVVLLNGCAMAAGFQIASVAATSLSYLISGKSLSDHVISGAMGSDCALHRLIEGQAPCRTEGEALVANSETGLAGTTTALAFTSATPLEIQDSSAPSIDTPDPSWQATGDFDKELSLFDADLMVDGGGPRLFVVLGSYRELQNARTHLTRAEGARITPAIIDDQQHFRVVLGPYGDSISALARSETGLQGWPVWLCPDTLQAPPCVTQVAQLTP